MKNNIKLLIITALLSGCSMPYSQPSLHQKDKIIANTEFEIILTKKTVCESDFTIDYFGKKNSINNMYYALLTCAGEETKSFFYPSYKEMLPDNFNVQISYDKKSNILKTTTTDFKYFTKNNDKLKNMQTMDFIASYMLIYFK